MSFGRWYSMDTNFSSNSYTNEDWESCANEKLSTSGGAFFLGNKLVFWLSKK